MNNLIQQYLISLGTTALRAGPCSADVLSAAFPPVMSCFSKSALSNSSETRSGAMISPALIWVRRLRRALIIVCVYVLAFTTCDMLLASCGIDPVWCS